MRLKQVLCLVLVLKGFVCTSPGDSQADDDLRFSFAPFYLWTVNVSGDQTIGPVSGSLDVDFSDIYDNLDGSIYPPFRHSA